MPCVLLLQRSFPFVLHAWVGRRKTAICAVSHETTAFGKQSKRKISHDSAHRPQNNAISLPIHCVFMFRAPLRKSHFARRTLLPELLTTGGAPKHRAECAKTRLSHQKVRKRGLVGACRAPAKCPKCCDSSSVSLMRRKKTTPYSRNTKRFSEKQLDRATRQECVIRNNGTYNFQTHFMLVFMSLPAPRPSSSPY